MVRNEKIYIAPYDIGNTVVNSCKIDSKLKINLIFYSTMNTTS